MGAGEVDEDAGSRDTPSGVCFDTSALIHLNDANVLDDVVSWFPEGSCHTAPVVIECELANSLANHPRNQEIIDATWLHPEPVATTGFWFLDEMRKLLGGRYGRGEGEAEVLTLCMQHGWAAVTNDRQARIIAGLNQVPALCTPELFVAAAAHELVTTSDGWELHCSVHADQERAPMKLGTSKAFESVFHKAVEEVQVWARRQVHDVKWPSVLVRLPRLDEIIAKLADAAGIPHERRGRRVVEPGQGLGGASGAMRQ